MNRVLCTQEVRIFFPHGSAKVIWSFCKAPMGPAYDAFSNKPSTTSWLYIEQSLKVHTRQWLFKAQASDLKLKVYNRRMLLQWTYKPAIPLHPPRNISGGIQDSSVLSFGSIAPAAMTGLSQLVTYASDLSAAAKTLADYCRDTGTTDSTPHLALPSNAPDEVHRARRNVLNNAGRLQILLAEPVDFIQRLASQVR